MGVGVAEDAAYRPSPQASLQCQHVPGLLGDPGFALQLGLARGDFLPLSFEVLSAKARCGRFLGEPVVSAAEFRDPDGLLDEASTRGGR